MSVFQVCEICGQLAQAACECSSPLRFYCDLHTSDHRRSGGAHPFRDSSIPLSDSETYLVRQVSQKYKRNLIQEAVLRRNRRIDDLFRQIRKIEEECAREIERIVKEASILEELSLHSALPTYSDNRFIAFLLSLKNSDGLTFEAIWKELLCNCPFLPSVSSSTQPLASSQWELFQQFKAHDGSIQSIAVSDCERYFASASRDKTIKIWDSDSRECIYTLVGHRGWVTSVSFWGTKVISGSDDTTIKIWEGDQCISTLSMHSKFVNSVCISTCKKLLASGSGDMTVIIYNLETNKKVHPPLLHSDHVNSVVFTPSNEHIVSGTRDINIMVWKTETGELLRTLSGHLDKVTCVFFVGSYLVSSSCDGTMKIWDIEEEEAIITLVKHSHTVVGLNGNEHILCSIGMDNSIKIWDIGTGECIQTLEGHGDTEDKWWYRMSVNLIKGGDFIISGGKDKNIKIFKRI